MDSTILLYGVIFACSTYSLIFSIYWWLKKRKAGTIYKIVMIYHLAFMVLTGVGGTSRAYRIIIDFDATFAFEWWWPVRLIIPAACTIAFALAITHRFCNKKESCSCEED